ncbi:uncharacterized protein L3040_003041 [Drepanopeziza brunnea f. sp. 'multigermtubi']|uniref:Uncharacterized protein n=1 Tax=Marssonina brunnea f. sp. multigermtubi (strain MB_m1) TaxID=1072389 RepID=K1W7Y4_MARBU|nr:uncharacterized protein MBM_08683 [Drepanopeziza brunnea f. sp. 'multigermtubi' MB_m1]EKD13240.1 hypothetical protein MBM_08683 [Drepanopeziza brunnea f. sp. 'multigermtubi' MB_m1]KAJ5047200.1 hypothetical protein L3040_003041 [Drepanopeziza brunnea f. sp. 'multigermtubi']
MGGNAFLTHSPPLRTPRMPFAIYRLILENALAILRQNFTRVAAPLEAPSKPDYGDVDILVSSPLSPARNPSVKPKAEVAELIARDLGARAWIPGQRSQEMNFAVPWPRSDDGEEGEDAAGGGEERYVQLDLHVLESEKEFKWHLFRAAHGDLWNILGSTIRRFGLTVNDKGMFLRIPSIEAFDRKKALVYLTDDSDAILDFLGLESARWWKQFGSIEEMFEYAAGCRLFRVKPEKEEGELEGDVMLDEGRQEGGEAGKKKLKHNDRQRMSKRPIFAMWMEEFIPKCRAEGRFLEMKTTREQIQQEALQTFGGREEFEKREREWKLEKHKDQMWRTVIKGTVPQDLDPVVRGATCRYFKGILMDGDILWHGEVPKAAERNEDGFWDLGAVQAFVESNIEEAQRLGMEWQQARAMASMRAKAEKKAIAMAEANHERPPEDAMVPI